MVMSNRMSDLAGLAAEQQGYFSRAQAWTVVSDQALRQAVRDGRLASPGRGIYRFTASPVHPHEDLWVAWLQLDPEQLSTERLGTPDALVFGRSALEVLGLGDLPANEHTFAVRRRRRLQRADIVLRLRAWGPDDWVRAEGMPVARPAWVVAEMVAEGADLEHMQGVIDDARWQHLLAPTDLEAWLIRYGRRADHALGTLR